MGLIRILFLYAAFLPTQTFAEEAGGEAPVDTKSVEQLARDIEISASQLPKKIQTNALIEQGKSCDLKKKLSDNLCLESLSPDITKFNSEYGTMLSGGIAAAGNLVDQCSKISDALKAAGLALGAYQMACGAAQQACNSSCANFKTQLQSVQKEIASVVCPTDGSYPNCNQMKEKISKKNLPETFSETAKKETTCQKYQVSLANAMAGGIAALGGLKKSKKCEEENSSGNAVAALDCNNAQSASYATTACMCVRGQMTAAQCQGISISGSGLGTGNISAGSIDPGIDSGTGTGVSSLDTSGDGFGVGQTHSSLAGAPPPVGGGAGVGGGSGGGSGGGAQDGALNAKKLNANVLGGFGGGGGGGGFGAGPGYDSKMKEYNPGEAKDPSRTPAAQAALQISAPAGKTNWEKVQLRYRDNKTSLLGK